MDGLVRELRGFVATYAIQPQGIGSGDVVIDVSARIVVIIRANALMRDELRAG